MADANAPDIEEIITQFIDGKISDDKELERLVTELIRSKLEQGGIKYG